MSFLSKLAPAAASAPAVPATQSAAQERPVIAPAVDIIDTGGDVVLYADLPGVAAAGLEVTVEGDRLTVRGTPAVPEPQGLRALHRETRPRIFERSFSLTEGIDRERIVARISDGVARITLPRSAAQTPRRIQVQVT